MNYFLTINEKDKIMSLENILKRPDLPEDVKEEFRKDMTEH